MDPDLRTDAPNGHRVLRHCARVTAMTFEQAAADLLSWYARVGRPLTRMVQRRITRRYLNALAGPDARLHP